MATPGLASRAPANAPASTFGERRSRYTENPALSHSLQTAHIHLDIVVASRERPNYSLGGLSPRAFLLTFVRRYDRMRGSGTIININLCVTMGRGYITDWIQRFTPIIIDPEPSTEAKELSPKPTFHPFSRLPAEIRVNIWAIALQDQYEDRPCDEDLWCFDWVENNVTLFTSHHRGFHVITSRGYPTHFFVNREARAEAARCDGGEWLPLGDGAVTVYINFNKEDVRLHDSCTGSLKDSLLHTRAWPILEKDAKCREVPEEDWGVFGRRREYGEKVVTSHWVGHKRAGERT